MSHRIHVLSLPSIVRLVSAGCEIADIDKPIGRSITGGTGLAKESGTRCVSLPTPLRAATPHP